MAHQTAPSKLDFDELYILSGLLQMPTQESYELVEDLAELWPWLQGLRDSVRSLPLEAWQQEYIQLFIHRSPRAPCPPYESVYCEELEPGECAARMAEVYIRAGERIPNMPPDFLGAELRLLAQLTEQPEGAADSQLAHELWDKMRGWVPRFAEDLVEHARLDIYRALGTRLRELFA